MLGFSNENWFFFVLGSGISLFTLWVGLKFGKAKGAILWGHAHHVRVLDSPSDIPEVEVTFRSKPIPRLVVSKVLFFNSGDAAVHKSMLVDKDPLRLAFDGGIVLDASVDADPNKVTRDISLQKNAAGTEVLVTFDFLNPGDGFEIRVWHTCGPDSPIIKGSLRGAKLNR